MDNGDAVVQSGEMRTLAELGIAEISTQFSLSFDAEGKIHIGSTVTRNDGSQLGTEDVFFAQYAANTPAHDYLDAGTLDGLLGPVPASSAAVAAAAPLSSAHGLSGSAFQDASALLESMHPALKSHAVIEQHLVQH